MTQETTAQAGQLPPQKEGWQKWMTQIAVLYRLSECRQDFELVNLGPYAEFVNPILQEMGADGLLSCDPDNNLWTITDKGADKMRQIVELTDIALKYEIFSAVDMSVELPEEIAEVDEETGEQTGFVWPPFYDPRFCQSDSDELDEEQWMDLRLVMFEYMAHKYSTPEGKAKTGGQTMTIDPYVIVFLTKLGKGEFRSDRDSFWVQLQLGTAFEEVITAVRRSWKPWQQMDENGDPEEAACLLDAVYTAGMSETCRREGDECAACGAPLAMEEAIASSNGEELTACPLCEADFSPPPPPEPPEAEYACAKCGGDIYAGQQRCGGCGYEVDFSLPEGSTSSHTETTTETVTEDVYDSYYDGYGLGGWGCSWGYEPYGYFHPYDPYYDAVAFGCLAAVVLW